MCQPILTISGATACKCGEGDCRNKGYLQGKTAQGASGTGGAVTIADSQYEAVFIKYCARLWL